MAPIKGAHYKTVLALTLHGKTAGTSPRLWLFLRTRRGGKARDGVQLTLSVLKRATADGGLLCSDPLDRSLSWIPPPPQTFRLRLAEHSCKSRVCV